MPLQLRSDCFLGLLVLFIAFTTTAMAQTEPDTVRRKRELPTGPVTQPRPQPQHLPPVVQPEPEVMKPQEVIPEQEPPLPPLERLFWGGSFGLQFGTYTSISLLPVLGYQATEKFWMGIGGVYHYQSDQYTSLSLHNYGGRVFAQQVIFNNFLIHGDYEQLSVEYLVPNYNSGGYDKRRVSKGIPMAGLGYRQRIGERGAADIVVLYNFNDTYPSPYSNPVIRAGFVIPFKR